MAFLSLWRMNSRESNIGRRISAQLAKLRTVNWAFADQVVVSGANFITGLILARGLGLEGFGVFTLAWTA